jgi:hypothetical protein
MGRVGGGRVRGGVRVRVRGRGRVRIERKGGKEAKIKASNGIRKYEKSTDQPTSKQPNQETNQQTKKRHVPHKE